MTGPALQPLATPAKAPLALAPSRRLQRQCDCGNHSADGGECESCKKKKLQRKPSMGSGPANVIPDSVHEVLGRPGRALDPDVRGFMEPRFRQNFSGVRVHADAQAAKSARDVGAYAYTVGSHVVFGHGQYAPSTETGRRLLAHELAHTVQQATGTARSGIAPADDPSEAEADRAAESVLSGGRPDLSLAGGNLQRQVRTFPGLEAPPTGTPYDHATRLMASVYGSTTLDGFATGSAQLLPWHHTDLRATATAIHALLLQYSLSTVRVTGHADTVGSEASNLTLGTARAEAVKAELVALGVPETAIISESEGEGGTQAVPTRDNVANASNRRVEVRFEPRASHLASMTGGLHLDPRPDLTYHEPLTGPGIWRPSWLPPPTSSPGTGGQLPAPTITFEEALGGLIQTPHSVDNPEPHASADLSSGAAASAPRDRSPATYTVTLIWRNFNVVAGDEHADVALDLLHEPNVSIQISPDPANPQVYQAAIALLNLHLRQHHEELVEISLGAQGQVGSSGTPGAAAQIQVELHLTSTFSLTASTSLGVSPHDPSAPRDPGSVPLGTAGGLDWSWSPFGVGVLFHLP